MRKYKYLLLSSLTGFLFGIIHYSSLQDVVENAQIIAGIIDYPYQTPQLYFQKTLWSLPAQLLAILLKLGFTERTLSILMSGLLGGLSFLSLSMFTYAVKKRDTLVGYCTPLVVFYFLLYDFAPTYDISLLDTKSTSGAFGLSWGVLTISSFLANKKRPSYTLLGLLASVHPIWFIWVSLIFLTHFILFNKEKKDSFLFSYPYLFAGLLVSIVSLTIYQLTVSTDTIAYITTNIDTYLDYFFSNWDVHRRTIPISAGVILALSLPLNTLKSRKENSELHQVMMVTSVLVLISTVISNLTSASHMLMPHRFLNIGIYIFPVLLLSIYSEKKSAIHNLLLFIGICFLHFYYGNYKSFEVLREQYLFNISVFMLCMIPIIFIPFKTKLFKYRKAPLYIVSFSILIKHIIAAGPALKYNLDDYQDYTNSEFFKFIQQRDGVLLTCPNCSHFQIRAKSPILLEVDTMDDLPYAPEMFQEFNHYFKKLYGLDLLNRDINWPRNVHVPQDAVKIAWEERSREDWKEIFSKYKLKGVVVPKHWKLKLNVISGRKESFYY